VTTDEYGDFTEKKKGNKMEEERQAGVNVNEGTSRGRIRSVVDPAHVEL
jgi:hypothetical protein